MRHIDFPRVDGLSTDTPDLGRHNDEENFVENYISRCMFLLKKCLFSSQKFWSQEKGAKLSCHNFW